MKTQPTLEDLGRVLRSDMRCLVLCRDTAWRISNMVDRNDSQLLNWLSEVWTCQHFIDSAGYLAHNWSI